MGRLGVTLGPLGERTDDGRADLAKFAPRLHERTIFVVALRPSLNHLGVICGPSCGHIRHLGVVQSLSCAILVLPLRKTDHALFLLHVLPGCRQLVPWCHQLAKAEEMCLFCFQKPRSLWFFCIQQSSGSRCAFFFFRANCRMCDVRIASQMKPVLDGLCRSCDV